PTSPPGGRARQGRPSRHGRPAARRVTPRLRVTPDAVQRRAKPGDALLIRVAREAPAGCHPAAARSSRGFPRWRDAAARAPRRRRSERPPTQECGGTRRSTRALTTLVITRLVRVIQ